jgi:hypothetical protein
MFAAVAVMSAFADTVTIKPSGDSGIEQHNPDFNLGGSSEVVAGTLGSSAGFEIRRALFKFDLQGQIPPGSTIDSVTLRVSVVFRLPLSPASSNFDLRRILQPWDENAVTWNSRLSGVLWDTPGAADASDTAGVASSSVFVSGLGNYTFPSTPAMVADVQGWLNDPSSSFGWLLLTEREATPRTARHFATREDSVNFPRLVINYTPPSPLAIVTQPQSQTNFVGSTVLLTVVASGTPPLNYGWEFNGNAIPGGTLQTLVLSNVQTNDSGTYTVTVSNNSGQTNSAPALLTILPPPPGLPIVNITSPTNGSILPTQFPVLLTSEAHESNGSIRQVEFFLNTNSIGVATSSPFDLLFTNSVPGNFVLSAIATDPRQVTATSSVVMVTFVGAPEVELRLDPPETNLLLGTSITNTAIITKGTEVANVDFFANGTFLGNAKAPPFTNAWQPTQEGDYSVLAIAIDELGQIGTSAPVVVRIHSRDLVPPRITITNAPSNFSGFTSPLVQIAGTASDDHRLDRVEYEVDSGPFLANIATNGLAQGASNWLASVTLLPGKNAVRVRSFDFAGNASPFLTRFYTYVSKGVLTVTTTGLGTVMPNLDGAELELGQIYNLTARPAPGYLFAGWEGAANAGNTNVPHLKFEMTEGLALVAHFVANPFIPRAGNYSGVFYDTNSPMLESSGLFILELKQKGNFSGKLLMNGAGYPFAAQFNMNGDSTVPVLRKSLAPVVLRLQLSMSGDTNQITGFITNASGNQAFISTLYAERNSFNVRSNPSQSYQLRFDVRRVSDQLVIGTGNASSSLSGIVWVRINLTDGPRLVLRSTLFQQGFDGQNLPIYLSINRGSENIVGLPHLEPNSINGALWWSKSGTNGPTELELVPSSN